MRSRYTLFITTILLFILITVGGIILTPSTSAQSQTIWAPLNRIPNYGYQTEDSPFMISDGTGLVHVFNSQPFDLDDTYSEEVIVYRTWTFEDGWTDPVDILINPVPGSGAFKVLDIYYADDGIVHLIAAGAGQIFYTFAPLAFAGQAGNWSPFIPIGAGGATIPYTGSLASDGQGNFYVIYSTVREGKGFDATISTDGGVSWSEPAYIYKTFNEDLSATSSDIHVDKDGVVHAVWAVIGSTGRNGEGYYIRYEPGPDAEWEFAQPIDTFYDGGLGIWFPVLYEYEDMVFASFYNGGPNNDDNAFWWRMTQDNGNTWTEARKYSPRHVGTNGPVSATIDGDGQLHVFFGQRIDDLNHGVWQTTWTDSSWSLPIPVVRGPQVRDDADGDGFDPRSPGIALVGGNQALVTWATDGFAGVNGVWYSFGTIDSSTVALIDEIPIPTPTATTTPRPTSTTIPTPTIEPTSTRAPTPVVESGLTTAIQSNPSAPLVISMLSVGLLIGIVAVIARTFN